MATLLAFLIPFGLVGWLMVSMLRFTKNMYSKNSLLYTAKTYQITDKQYWINLNTFLAVYLCCMGLFLLFEIPIIYHSKYSWEILLILIFIAFLVAVAYFILYYQYQFRILTKDIAITYSPNPTYIEINSRHKTIKINIPQDIGRVEFYQAAGRLRLDYFKFYLVSGEIAYLDARFVPYIFSIEHLAHIPITYIRSTFPKIEEFDK